MSCSKITLLTFLKTKKTKVMFRGIVLIENVRICVNIVNMRLKEGKILFKGESNIENNCY